MGGAALHFGWVAEMKTGEGKTLVSTLPVYLNGLTGKGVHLVTVNDYLARRDSEWMGQIHRWLGLVRRSRHPGRLRLGRQARAVRLRHHLRHQQRVRLRLPPRQHGHEPRPAGAAGPQLLHRRRGRLDPHRRGPHAADHHRPGEPTRPSSTTSSPASCAASSATSTTTSTRRSARSAPTEEGIEAVEQALGVENLYDEVSTEPRAPAAGRAQGQGAVPARQGLHRAARRGEDRRRVHRAHPRGPALVRGPAPGRRGQGGREDQGGEPDPRHDHAAELLPHVRQARRHDGHGRDRGRPSWPAPTTCRSCRSRRTSRWSATTRPTSSTRPRRPSSTPWSRTSLERYETGQPVLVGTISVEKSEKLSRLLEKRGIDPRGAERQAAHA